MVWVCPTCGKRGTVRDRREENGIGLGGEMTWRVVGSYYECVNGHCWERPYK
jgi:hypothetical protein